MWRRRQAPVRPRRHHARRRHDRPGPHHPRDAGAPPLSVRPAVRFGRRQRVEGLTMAIEVAPEVAPRTNGQLTASGLEERFMTLHEIVRAAKANLHPNPWDYLIGGSETETTLRRNRLAIDSLGFRPRVLR